MPTPVIRVCRGKKCNDAGSPRILKQLEADFGEENVVSAECFGFCESAPNVKADDMLYTDCRTANITGRIKNAEGKVLKKLTPEDLELDELI